MPNTLIIPNSGTIYFSTETAGASTIPSLTGQAVSLAHDGQAGLVVSSLNTSTSATNRFRINGANGALLAVTDEVTGIVFSVNDPAGLPIISADTGLNDIITIGTFGSNALVVRNDKVGIGTTLPTEKLTVSGNIIASGNITASNYNPSANIPAFLAAPTSSNLAAAVADETGSGALVFANTPTLVTPDIGAATGASLNVTGNLTASGTASSLPNQTLLATDDTRILTKKTSARDDMWSAWQKRRILYNFSSAVGTSYAGTGANSGILYGVTCGTSAIGRAGSFGETGMTLNPGQGASWNIPSSFATAFGFYSLMVNNTLTSNNITSGSTTFTVSTTNHLISVGHRIWSSAFPEETYVSAVSGTSVTATQAASSTPTTPHTVVFSPDQIARVVLGTSNLVANYILECPNARESFLTPVGAAIGATSLQINSNIVSTGVVNMWSGQPYFILTTTNASISNANGTTFYAACSNFPVSATALSVLRCDNATGTPTTTTGTWTGPGTNQIVVGVANNIIAGQTVSGLGIPQNTTVQSVSGTTITLNQMITSSGSGVALYFGYQRIYVDQNATATATGQGCGFIAKNVSGSYAYGRGITGGTTITNIINGPISGFNLVISNALTKAYVAGVPIAINFANNPTALNSCIFMDFGADPSDGYLKVRLGYMNNGLITYSAWTSFPKGNVVSSYNSFFQAVIDYNAATDKLRLFVDRNGDILVGGNPRDVPKPPSTPTITMTGVSTLNGAYTNIYFGTHIYGNAVNTLGSTTIAQFSVRELIYYPYQTFID